MGVDINSNRVIRRPGRPRRVYDSICISYQAMISVIKSKRRMLLISKGSMYDFIIKYIDADYDVKNTKQEMLSVLEQYLTEQTIGLYVSEFERFGICKKDLQEILKIRRSSMLAVLEVNGITFRNVSYHTVNISKGRYHMYNPTELLKLNGYQPY